jgi:hypothetical protein
MSLVAFNHLIVLLSLLHAGPCLAKNQAVGQVRTLHQIPVLEDGVHVNPHKSFKDDPIHRTAKD